ncbi:hypothetical protein GLYMA_07G086250v4 [Glycine max]|nr:hypothetical protein GLYMA_07G086250v4 [Glycine max]KAH1085993.1 hypothetical protein GYH30_017800 [Glycine max]
MLTLLLVLNFFFTSNYRLLYCKCLVSNGCYKFKI